MSSRSQPPAPDSAPQPRRRSARRFLALAMLGGLAVRSTLLALIVRTTDGCRGSRLCAPADPGPGGLLAAAVFVAVSGVIIVLLLLVLRGPRREWERVAELILTQPRHFRNMLLGSSVLVLSELSLPMAILYLLNVVVNQRRDATLLLIAFVLILLLLGIRAAAGCA
jgi:hypothetical protein